MWFIFLWPFITYLKKKIVGVPAWSIEREKLNIYSLLENLARLEVSSTLGPNRVLHSPSVIHNTTTEGPLYLLYYSTLLLLLLLITNCASKQCTTRMENSRRSGRTDSSTRDSYYTALPLRPLVKLSRTRREHRLQSSLLHNCFYLNPYNYVILQMS